LQDERTSGLYVIVQFGFAGQSLLALALLRAHRRLQRERWWTCSRVIALFIWGESVLKDFDRTNLPGIGGFISGVINLNIWLQESPASVVLRMLMS